LYDAANINTAVRWERHALLARRWLRHEAAEVMDDWQDEDFRALDPGFLRAVGHQVKGGHSRAWLERGRGHSKTQDLAVMSTWALAFAPRTIKGVAAANDREQARLMRDSIERLPGRIVYAGGLDCGWRSDHSALCIVSYDTGERRYELADVKSRDPKDYDGELPPEIIRAACREAHYRYRLDSLVFDDSGFIDSGQQLVALGLPVSLY
jgi:hypothetical protein